MARDGKNLRTSVQLKEGDQPIDITECDLREDAFRHVGHEDRDEDEDVVEDRVSSNESNDEQQESIEEGDHSDDVHEAIELLAQCRLLRAQAAGETRDPSEHCVVADVHHDAHARALHCVRREERQVLRLHRVIMRRLRYSGLRLRLASHRRVVHFEGTANIFLLNKARSYRQENRESFLSSLLARKLYSCARNCARILQNLSRNLQEFAVQESCRLVKETCQDVNDMYSYVYCTAVFLKLWYSCHLWHFDQKIVALCLYFYVALLTQRC